MLRDGAKQGGQAHSAGWHRMGTSRAVAEQACRIVLRRMQDHLGACGGVDEKCDVGDGDERSPHESCVRQRPKGPVPLKLINQLIN